MFSDNNSVSGSQHKFFTCSSFRNNNSCRIIQLKDSVNIIWVRRLENYNLEHQNGLLQGIFFVCLFFLDFSPDEISRKFCSQEVLC